MNQTRKVAIRLNPDTPFEAGDLVEIIPHSLAGNIFAVSAIAPRAVVMSVEGDWATVQHCGGNDRPIVKHTYQTIHLRHVPLDAREGKRRFKARKSKRKCVVVKCSKPVE